MQRYRQKFHVKRRKHETTERTEENSVFSKRFSFKRYNYRIDYLIKESGNGRVKDGNKTTDNLRDHRGEEKITVSNLLIVS